MVRELPCIVKLREAVTLVYVCASAHIIVVDVFRQHDVVLTDFPLRRRRDLDPVSPAVFQGISVYLESVGCVRWGFPVKVGRNIKYL